MLWVECAENNEVNDACVEQVSLSKNQTASALAYGLFRGEPLDWKYTIPKMRASGTMPVERKPDRICRCVDCKNSTKCWLLVETGFVFRARETIHQQVNVSVFLLSCQRIGTDRSCAGLFSGGGKKTWKQWYVRVWKIKINWELQMSLLWIDFKTTQFWRDARGGSSEKNNQGREMCFAGRVLS